jgi:hypothetical protein
MSNGDGLYEPEDARRDDVIEDLRETVKDLVHQFGYQTTKDGVPCLWTGGLSALEGAFATLGWDDPHPVPGQACEHLDCYQWATCGTPTPDGYKRLCYSHYAEVQPARAAEATDD